VKVAELRWHYGPTDDDPEPGKMWHDACSGEVWSFKDGALICRRCAQWQDDEDEASQHPHATVFPL